MPLEPADCWFLTGPTASGKTAVGLALARLLDAEIVSMDSMALYRGMDVGTAKAHARRAAGQAPHHLIDVVEPERGLQPGPSTWRPRGRRFEDSPGPGPARAVRRRHALVSQVALAGDFRRPGGRLGTAPPARGAGPGVEAPNWLHARLAEIDPASARRSAPAGHAALDPRDRGVSRKPASRSAACRASSTRPGPPDACRVFLLELAARAAPGAHRRARRRDVRRRPGRGSARACWHCRKKCSAAPRARPWAIAR
jgi:hypothetical protein